VLSSHPVMKDKLPVTIRKRLEASSEALAALAEHQPGRRALFSPPSSAGGWVDPGGRAHASQREEVSPCTDR
jgi:hypothetical protein